MLVTAAGILTEVTIICLSTADIAGSNSASNNSRQKYNLGKCPISMTTTLVYFDSKPFSNGELV